MRSFAALLGFLLVVAGLVTAFEGPEWIPGVEGVLPGADDDSDRVLVFLVGSPAGVERVSDAVDPDRVVAWSPDAVALVEGRIVATDQAAVGDALLGAGWVDREIEIISVGATDTPRGGRGGGAQEPVDPERLALLKKLMKQPTLNRAEQLFVMQAMNDGIAF